MANKRKSRVPLWGRILILIPLLPVIASLYWAGKSERAGLFESSLPADTGSSLTLPVYLPASDFTLIDTIQIYTEDNLYKKIDGHDVAFFRFGFQALTFASYGGSDDTFVDVFAYRMNRQENALGIFANERSVERDRLSVDVVGYRSGGGVFFMRGPWYIQIIPSNENPATAGAVDELVDSVLAVIPIPTRPIEQLAWFPQPERIHLSEGYLPDNAFGTDFLTNVFTAEYELNQSRVTAFRHRSDSAAMIFDRYDNFLSSVASHIDTVVIHGHSVHRYTSYGEETWTLVNGNDIIGITGIPEGVHAESLMENLLESASTEKPNGSHL